MDVVAVWGQIMRVLRSPKKFFESSKKEKSWKKALPFIMVSAAIGHILTAVYNIVFSPSISPEIADTLGIAETSFTAAEVIPAVIISYIITIGMSFIWGGALKVWLSLFKVESSYSQSYRVMAYSRTPIYILSWLPFINLVVALYSFYLMMVGLTVIYSVSRKKAIVVIVTGVLALAVLSLVFLSFDSV